jgi:cytochrome b
MIIDCLAANMMIYFKFIKFGHKRHTPLALVAVAESAVAMVWGWLRTEGTRL